MNNLEKSLQAFFESEAKVVVIKGDWGVGKTYFWDQYISRKISSGSLHQLAYSYISLFGSSSLEDVRKRVFHNAKAIGSDKAVNQAFDNEFNESNLLSNKLHWVHGGIEKIKRKLLSLNGFSRKSQSLPIVSKYSGLISNLEYSLVKNYIVCIDDMERKGKGLAVKEIMGLVDELAHRKKCKVILIFNESSFDNEDDKNQFDSYREKVVDIEINYNPTYKENLACIFSEKDTGYSTLENVARILNIRNIRVIKKIKWALESLYEYVRNSDIQIIDELIVHTALLCRFYYIRDNDLTYTLLREQLAENSWLSFITDKETDISAGEKKFRNLTSNIHLSSSVFDDHIAFFLENGYINEEELKITVAECNEKVRIYAVSARLKRAWNIYSGSFLDNIDDFKNSLIEIINEDTSRIEFSDFYSAINILEDFGEDITPFVDHYMKINSDSLSCIDPINSWDIGRIKSNYLKKKIKELHNNTKNYNLDEVSLKIATNGSWNSEDINFLNSLTKEDYIKWMKSSPEQLVTKVRSGLLTFKDFHSSNDEKFKNITANVIAALKAIASENELNRYRVRAIYDVE